MEDIDAYLDFTKRFKLHISKYPDLITLTLSNIFTMRLIGNKTHGDLAEIAIAEIVHVRFPLDSCWQVSLSSRQVAS